MFLHLQIPGFHAAVHQANDPSLQHRPVAVAMDARLHAPLFATSPEARLRHIEPGMSADVAVRRCPDLIVVPPDPHAYRQAQRQLSRICRTYTPRVGGTTGRLDLDLTPTRTAQATRANDIPAQTGEEASVRHIAASIRRRCASELHLDGYLGGSARLLEARMAATLARAPHMAHDGIVVIAIGNECAMTDLMPVGLFTDCQAHVRDLLGLCGIATMGQLRTLSADSLLGLLGPAGTAIYESMHGLRDEVISEIADPEPSVSAGCHCGPTGAGPSTSGDMIKLLAREVGVQLRQRQLACLRVTLEVSWLVTPKSAFTARLSRPSLADHDLCCAGATLFGRNRHRDARAAHLRLIVTGLCMAESPEYAGTDHAVSI
jgi:DNA polymerase-4